MSKSFLHQFIIDYIKKIIVTVNPKLEIYRCYSKVFNGKKPDLKNPKNLIEKIYWMELNCDTSRWTKCADKYRMREYVEECGYGEYLPKLYAKWDKAEEIDFTDLPKEFVLKANDGCGTVYVVKDKSKEDVNKVRKMVKQWMRLPHFGYMNAQLHYLPIKSCIIAEELLHQGEELDRLSPNSMVDFKFWSFAGDVESCLITYNRSSNSHNVALYNKEWNDISHHVTKRGNYDKTKKFSKPICFDEMTEIASVLSRTFPEMRVDFYITDKNKPVIGELTLSAGYGTLSEEYYEYLGSKVDITMCSKKKL